jgi:hypothetical protein
MELSDLMPNKIGYSIRGSIIHYKKLVNIPICYIDTYDNAYVFLDMRIKKEVIRFVQNLIRKGVKFYFAYPDTANPSGVLNYKEKVIYHYMIIFLGVLEHEKNDRSLYKGLENIGVDYFKNLVEWCLMEDCLPLLKKIYDELKPKVDKSYYDPYTKGKIHNYPEEVRDEYHSLWREIQLNLIL